MDECQLGVSGPLDTQGNQATIATKALIKNSRKDRMCADLCLIYIVEASAHI